LIADAYMMGVDPADLRRRMHESLDALVRLLHGETVTMQTDWFTLREARLHILPYQAPTMEMSVASAISPTGALAAGALPRPAHARTPKRASTGPASRTTRSTPPTPASVATRRPTAAAPAGTGV
jgi:alkanesulfonate monooxygenase SsuD/methylene tetrahydromethanopterin reductase-like flavin-dependent oxidoreductase (luciferase family)